MREDFHKQTYGSIQVGMYSTFLHEAQLIGFAYDLEQELQARAQPQFLGSPVLVPNAGVCKGLPKKPHVFTGKAHLLHGRIV